jgi:hypothetical protein
MSIEGVGRFAAGFFSTAPAARETAEPRQPPPKAEDVRAVLTADELNYFAELGKLGTLSYGRRGANRAEGPSPVLGQRIDARA